MTNKIGIGIEAKFDTSSVDAGVKAITEKLNQANKTQFNPVSPKATKDVSDLDKKLQQLLRVDGELRRRMKATGQTGTSFSDLDLNAMYPDAGARRRKQAAINRYLGIDAPQASGGAMGPGGGAGRPAGGGGSGFGAMAGGVVQSGLRAAGPAGGVAAGALGTGMSAGIGAGLMGLLGGMLALGVGKLVSAGLEKIDQAERNNIGMDTLKRQLGDVNVSFNALKTVVNSSADNLKITYEEAGRLASQFTKLGNLTGDQYKTLSEEMNVGVGMSRAFGMDPSAGVGVMGQMRGLGVTKDTQESRRFALLIGETIGKSNAFAKSEEVMEALASFTASQTRQNAGVANVAGYAGMFSSMVGSGIAGLDTTGSAALLSRINASLSAGGAKGEASQFFTGSIGASMGLNPYETRMLREAGAFGTNDSVFGAGSAYARYKGRTGPGGNTTFLQASLEKLRAQYGNGGNSDELAEATANHLGIGINQAMALLSIKPNEMGEMQKYGDLSKLSGSGIGNLSKALYGSAAERQGLAQSMLGRKDVSGEDKDQIKAAMGTPQEREVLARLAAQYDQERTTGSDIRDSKNALDNIKTAVADKMVPLMTEMRLGIMHIAGGGKKSSAQIMKEVIDVDSDERKKAITGQFSAEETELQKKKSRALAAMNPGMRDFMINPKSAEQYQKEKLQAEKDLAEASARLAEIEKTKADLLDKENKRREAEQAEVDKNEQARLAGGDQVTLPDGTRVGSSGELPAGSIGGRYFTTGGGRGTGGGSVGGGAALSSNATNDAMQFFMSKGWTKEQASGIVANLWAESKLNAGSVGDSGSAYGVGQWHADRQLDFARWSGHDIRGSTREEQLGFVHYELTAGKEQAAGNRLRNSSTAEQAGDIGSRYYERPRAVDSDAAARAELAARINAGFNTPLPAGAGPYNGRVSRAHITADDITVHVVDGNGKPLAASQQIPTRVQPNWRPSMGY